MPKKGEKNFIMSTISTRPGSEHSQKNSKTIQKSKKKKKKRHSSFVYSQIGLGQAKKEIYIYIYFFFFFFFLRFQVPFLPNPGWRIPKKIVKKFKKLKNVIWSSFLYKLGQDKPKKEK